MKRFLVTATISILLYEIFSTAYLFITDVEKLNSNSVSRVSRIAANEIDTNLAFYRRVKLIDIFASADYFCVAARERNPFASLRERGIEDHNVDYSAFGFLGYFGWDSNRSYVSIVYRDNSAIIVEMNMFDVNENQGGCSREMTLKFDDDTKEVFTFEGEGE